MIRAELHCTAWVKRDLPVELGFVRVSRTDGRGWFLESARGASMFWTLSMRRETCSWRKELWEIIASLMTPVKSVREFMGIRVRSASEVNFSKRKGACSWATSRSISSFNIRKFTVGDDSNLHLNFIVKIRWECGLDLGTKRGC